MTRLVFSASNVQRQFNRTLGTEIIAGAVLQKQIIQAFSFQICRSRRNTVVRRGCASVPLTLEYCILSTMSSLVSGIRPDEMGKSKCKHRRSGSSYILFEKRIKPSEIHTNSVSNKFVMQYWWIGINLDPVDSCKHTTSESALVLLDYTGDK